MIGRVTESMKYGILTGSIFNVQVKSAGLMEKISTQKNINRPSDDPVGAGKVLNYNSTLASIEQYQNNITNAETWLSVTDTALSGIKDLVSKAQTVAAAQYGTDGSDETMDSSADFVSGLIDSALALMNTKQGDSYIFGGSRTDVTPFTLTPTATKIGNVTGTSTNTSTGTAGIKFGSLYTGSENKAYAVKIVDTGALGTATCKISNDGGKTWSDTQYIPSSGELDLGDGVTMTFTAGNYVANDLFTVNASVLPTIGAASAASANTFNGTVTSGGNYTGTENKTYAVKVIDGGVLGTATCRISSDGGKTWSDPPVTIPDSSGSLSLGDGVTMAFDDSAATQKNLKAGESFSINAYAAGYYQGDDNNLKVQIGKNNNFAYNITGSDAFTAANRPTATAAITSSSALTVEDTITLSRGDSAGSWTITGHDQYPNMVITSISDTKITIDADNTDSNTTPDITLTLSAGKWQKGDTATFSILEGGSTTLTPVLSSVEVEGPGTVDLLGTLNALKSALEAHDENAVAAQIDDLANIQTQVLQAQTEAGSKSGSLELAKTGLTNLNEQITSMKSKIEDADLDKLIVSYQMEQVALEASYNLASKIGQMTIMDYLR